MSSHVTLDTYIDLYCFLFLAVLYDFLYLILAVLSNYLYLVLAVLSDFLYFILAVLSDFLYDKLSRTFILAAGTFTFSTGTSLVMYLASYNILF